MNVFKISENNLINIGLFLEAKINLTRWENKEVDIKIILCGRNSSLFNKVLTFIFQLKDINRWSSRQDATQFLWVTEFMKYLHLKSSWYLYLFDLFDVFKLKFKVKKESKRGI